MRCRRCRASLRPGRARASPRRCRRPRPNCPSRTEPAPMTNLSRARLIAILVPNALLWGAIGSQYIGHLVPCEMCMWQRWPHVAAIVLALIAILLRGNPSASRAFTVLAALAILVSGGLGVYHAGVEY